jgi:amino acid transporter
VLTGEGLAVAVTLMALMTAVNFLSIKKLANANSAITWWQVGVPLLTIFGLAVVSFQTSNFTAADGFNPYGAKGILSAVSTSGIIFALLGFEQADQLAGESSNPRRDIPRAVIGSVVIGIFIYIALQIVFLAALTPSSIGDTWSKGGFLDFTEPFAQVATLASVGWLAAIIFADAVISPSGTA